MKSDRITVIILSALVLGSAIFMGMRIKANIVVCHTYFEEIDVITCLSSSKLNLMRKIE